MAIKSVLSLKEVPLLINYISEIITIFVAILVRLNGSELAANGDVVRVARLREAAKLDTLAEQQAVR
jgi:hypothetical protein